MNRHTVLTLSLALALPFVGARANDTGNDGKAGDQGTQLQAPAADATNLPAAQDPNQAPPNNAPPDQKSAPPDNAQPDQNPAPPNNVPPNGAPLDQPQQNPAAPNGAPPSAAPPDQRQPNAGRPNAEQANPAPGASAVNSGAFSSPLQEFVSHQVAEVGALSRQIDQFRAAKRPDAVMALYHMIRDHTLVADAARNVLARRGEVSEPTFIPTETIGSSPQDVIRQDVQMHEQALSQVQQLLANASSPEEKSIYQRAVNATNKHLDWLRAMDQGQKVQIGFFGPTVPLSRIAGYREEASISSAAGNQSGMNGRRSGTAAPHRRSRRARYHASRGMRRYR